LYDFPALVFDQCQSLGLNSLRSLDLLSASAYRLRLLLAEVRVEKIRGDDW